MRPTLLALSVATLAAGCASTPPEADPVQLKLNDLDARITRIERIVANQVEAPSIWMKCRATCASCAGGSRSSSTANEALAKQHAICTPIWTSAWRQRAGRRPATPPVRLLRWGRRDPGAAAGCSRRQRAVLGRAGGVYPGV